MAISNTAIVAAVSLLLTGTTGLAGPAAQGMIAPLRVRPVTLTATAGLPLLNSAPSRRHINLIGRAPVLGAAARAQLASQGMKVMDFQSSTVTVTPAHPFASGVTLYATGPIQEFSAGGGSGYIQISSAAPGTNLYTSTALVISLSGANTGQTYLIDVSVSANWNGAGTCDWKMSADTVTFQYQSCKNTGGNAFAQQDILVAIKGQGGTVTDLYLENEYSPSTYWYFNGATVTPVP